MGPSLSSPFTNSHNQQRSDYWTFLYRGRPLEVQAAPTNPLTVNLLFTTSLFMISDEISSVSDYVEATARTWSNEFHEYLLEGRALAVDMEEVADRLDSSLDDAKKALFYGDEETSRKECRDYLLSNCFKSEKQKYILHATLGIATEAGEILEAVSARFMGNDIDFVNVSEEIGDLLYYVARLADAIGVDLLEVMKTNIEKLEERFPEDFNQEDALNRDTDQEREILES